MESMHMYILNTIRPDVELALKKRSQNIQKFTDNEILYIVFKNFRYRKNKPNGLRLSFFGYSAMCKHFESHTYAHDTALNHKLLFELDKKMLWPYYISNSLVTFFSDSDASWFKLNNNDLSKFLEYI